MELYSSEKYRRYTHSRYDSYISGFPPDESRNNGRNLLFPVNCQMEKASYFHVPANQILNVIGERSVFLSGCFDGEFLQARIQTEAG